MINDIVEVLRLMKVDSAYRVRKWAEDILTETGKPEVNVSISFEPKTKRFAANFGQQLQHSTSRHDDKK